jgi:preprotein translocase subunit SecE
LWVQVLPGLPGTFQRRLFKGGVLDVNKEKLVAAQKRKKLTIIQKLQRFWRETIGELRKVTWPTPEEAWKMTKLVVVVMLLMAMILGVLDFVFSRFITFLVAL